MADKEVKKRLRLPSVASLALPGVSTLIAFLAYSSQILFRHLEPHPLDERQQIIFNMLVVCIWICYFRACFVNPGGFPASGEPNLTEPSEKSAEEIVDSSIAKRQKSWCRKCNAPKPLRAHHCKTCKQCIPKMDHHCPWTVNCVSHRTFPHFLRFVFYAVVSMSYLEYFLYERGAFLWSTRHLPSYLGPSVTQLTHLFALMATNTLTLFALSILLIRSIWSLATNTTTIEGWELERHTALVRRARLQGGFVWGPDGIKVPIRRQEFPYDIGIWKNVRQGMGGSNNVISWFWPFAASPSIQSALSFEVNGFEDATVTWPPPDPDRIPRLTRPDDKEAFTYRDDGDSFETASGIEAFRQRQQADLRRRRHLVQDMPPDQISDNDDDKYSNEDEDGIRMEAGSDVDEDAALSGEEEEQVEEEGKGSESESDGEGGELWTNSEGDRLKDFGVDEDAEGYTASR